MSGMMFHLGDGDRTPVRIGVPQAYLQAAGQAAVGTLVAHHWREQTGEGQWVEVSAQAAMMWAMMSETGLPSLHGYVPFRDGVHARYAGVRRRIIFAGAGGYGALVARGGCQGAPRGRGGGGGAGPALQAGGGGARRGPAPPPAPRRAGAGGTG